MHACITTASWFSLHEWRVAGLLHCLMHQHYLVMSHTCVHGGAREQSTPQKSDRQIRALELRHRTQNHIRVPALRTLYTYVIQERLADLTARRQIGKAFCNCHYHFHKRSVFPRNAPTLEVSPSGKASAVSQQNFTIHK
jgi:hypothetical protein